MSAMKMRVKIYSFDHKILEEAVKKLIQVIVRSGGKVKGPIPMKTKKKIVTLQRSTFVFKKAKDKLECRIHKRLIDIDDVNSEVINNLSTLTLPAGVDLNIETV
ncbi:30S ribosomal protein S10 [Candidatus Gracilibacteria bacterium]|nr:30S ribosomal protein S10 [Candidatus Gracilibacteria bacterium]